MSNPAQVHIVTANHCRSAYGVESREIRNALTDTCYVGQDTLLATAKPAAQPAVLPALALLVPATSGFALLVPATWCCTRSDAVAATTRPSFLCLHA